MGLAGEGARRESIIDFRACLLPVSRDCSFPRGCGGIHAAPGIYLERSARDIKRPSWPINACATLRCSSAASDTANNPPFESLWSQNDNRANTSRPLGSVEAWMTARASVLRNAIDVRFEDTGLLSRELVANEKWLGSSYARIGLFMSVIAPRLSYPYQRQDLLRFCPPGISLSYFLVLSSRSFLLGC